MNFFFNFAQPHWKAPTTYFRVWRKITFFVLNKFHGFTVKLSHHQPPIYLHLALTLLSLFEIVGSVCWFTLYSCFSFTLLYPRRQRFFLQIWDYKSLVKEFENVIYNFLKYVYIKKWIKICIMLFKNWKWMFKISYQIGFNFFKTYTCMQGLNLKSLTSLINWNALILLFLLLYIDKKKNLFYNKINK